MKSWREWAVELAVMAALAALFAILGPFGTSILPWPVAFADWLLFALGGYAFFRPVIAGGQALADLTPLPRWLAITFACLLASFPTTMLVGWALSGMNLRQIAIGALVDLYPKVAFIGGVATIIQLLAQSRRQHIPSFLTSTPTQAGAQLERDNDKVLADPITAFPTGPRPAPGYEMGNNAPVPFLDRLPAHLGRDLLCLENEDHYVRAYTRQGSTLILIRLRDAVAELDGIEGARVHRSWWVARAAVAGILRRDRAIALRLTDGREVPVARAAAPDLRAAGWW